MAFFRPSRKTEGPDPFVNLKIALFWIGAGLAIAGMISGLGILVWVGILVLAVGVLFRLLQRGE
jgi:hypothetical protein